MNMHAHQETNSEPSPITSKTVLSLGLDDWFKLAAGAVAITFTVLGIGYNHVQKEQEKLVMIEQRIQLLEDERKYRDLQLNHMASNVEDTKKICCIIGC